MVRKVLLAAFVLSLIVSAAAQNAPSAPTVVPSSDLKKVVPDSYFFRGLSATTQLRNSSAIHYPDDFYVIVGLVALLLVMLLTLAGAVKREHAERTEVLALYWHFVDGIWVVVFTVVYIIGR